MDYLEFKINRLRENPAKCARKMGCLSRIIHASTKIEIRQKTEVSVGFVFGVNAVHYVVTVLLPPETAQRKQNGLTSFYAERSIREEKYTKHICWSIVFPDRNYEQFCSNHIRGYILMNKRNVI